MANVDLSKYEWSVRGWRPWMWRLACSMETGSVLAPDVDPVPAHVPGTVQRALLEAGLIPDWNGGVNSLACEWVEHRHWEFFTRLDAKACAHDRRIVLDAQGLDYSGWILIDNVQVGEFTGCHTPHRLDLTEALRGKDLAVLRIVFDVPPPEQGQVGFTSKSTYFKPRYNYSWDWCPRFVPIGVSRSLSLLSDVDCEVNVTHVRTELSDSLDAGCVDIVCECASSEQEGLTRQVRLLDSEHVVAVHQEACACGIQNIHLDIPAVRPWYPNGAGAQHRYQLVVELVDQQGRSHVVDSRTVGFKSVVWKACRNAPEQALPWICQVNGKALFLQGVNWTPVLMNYHDTPNASYRKLLELYRDMGCNLLRVWGGGFLEGDAFFEYCDELGLMVWQEFPLSSSGIENTPPQDPSVINELVNIANVYLQRCGHHPSLLMWCGGNELMGAVEVPSDAKDPCLAALADKVQERHPQAHYVPTSPSGPAFYAKKENFGRQIHHDVHGPWGFNGFDGMAGWKAYWEQDDALIRTEVGVPAASSQAVIDTYCGDEIWPLPNFTVRHSSSWWMMCNEHRELMELPKEQGLPLYIERTQERQAEALAVAAECCKTRFPQCGGFLVWMGHDAFPCFSNTSIIDFDGTPKPAYFTLQKVFKSQPE